MSEELLERLNVQSLPWEITGMPVTELMSLRNKVAAVTGGGGPSLGRSISHQLAALGASVAVVDRSVDGAQRTVDETPTRPNGGRGLAVECDVSNADAVSSAVDHITEELGPIDIWVNNVGLPRFPGQEKFAFHELTPSDIDWFVGTNLLGAMYCANAVLPRMIERGRGRIINIAAESGKSWTYRQTCYSTSKAGVIGFTRSLAHELTGTGVSAVAVCPGIMITKEVIEALRAIPEGQDNPIETSFRRVAAGRPSLPQEVAHIVAFLATPAGSYLQGTAISAGGGLSD